MADRWNSYQTDVLFLLVGTNPLPNYVAGCLLAKPQTTIVLLPTSDTFEIAKNLRFLFQQFKRKQDLNWDIPEPHEIDHSEGSKIYSEVRSLAQKYRSRGSIGLNYTGGTKAMAVHAFRSIYDEDQQAVFSYLDANTLGMRIFRNGMLDRFIPTGTDCEVRLDELIRLHGRNIKAQPRSEPLFLTTAHEFARIFQTTPQLAEEWSDYCRRQFKHDSGKWKSKSALSEIVIPQEGDFASFFRPFSVEASNLGKFTTALKNKLRISGWNVVKMAKWLDGVWLEHYVLDALLQIKAKLNLHEVGMGFQVALGDENFEFDVAAILGYQLFAISCTTSSEKGLCKHKLFEAYLRSQQMGGEESYTALVSLYTNPQRLKNELEESWHTQGHIEVFGPDDLLNLSTRLHEWISQAAHL